MASIRIKNLNELGKGQWTVVDEKKPVISKPATISERSIIKDTKKPDQKPKKTKARQELEGHIKAVSPEIILRDQLISIYGRRVSPQYVGAIPDRRFSLDCAFVNEKVAIEFDGWAFHGKFLNDFKRDRYKDKQLTLNGWRILRFTAEEINKRFDQCLAEIDQCLKMGVASSLDHLIDLTRK